MSFDYNIHHYTFDDLKKLFNVKDGETVSIEEIDMRIANIRYTAEQNTSNPKELSNILNFLPVAKEKFKIFVQTQNIEYNNVYPMTEKLQKKFIPNKMLDKNEHAIIEHTPDIDIPTENKYVNINTCDRDTDSWPLSSEFEIELPDALKDVTFATLFDYNFFGSMYNISEFYQNTKMTFSYDGGVDQTITLDDGFYTDTQLGEIVCLIMNEADNEVNNSNDNNDSKEYNNYEGMGIGYKFDINTKKYTFFDTNVKNKPFTLKFDKPETYPTTEKSRWQIRNIYNLPIAWGLGYFLGFDKGTTYTSGEKFVYGGKKDDGSDVTGGYFQAIAAPNITASSLNHNLFMEIEGFNHVQQTRQTSGMVNSYFSRIPIINGFGNDVGGYERANINKERVSKLKFRLRFHTGILIDMQGQNFDFTLMFGCKK
jgi:hypothetical protein